MNVESSPVNGNGLIPQDQENLGKESSCDTMSTEWLSGDDLDRMIKLAESVMASCQRLIAIGDQATAPAALTTTSLVTPTSTVPMPPSPILPEVVPVIEVENTPTRHESNHPKIESSELRERPPSHVTRWKDCLSNRQQVLVLLRSKQTLMMS
ncbi:unnamed protein product [Linum trigynum]|uniref:Uncharacterized protein n=1 Tax=Linum trigynum TaxID=586398 RepID=A0AAV2FWQ6_9ROSI